MPRIHAGVRPVRLVRIGSDPVANIHPQVESRPDAELAVSVFDPLVVSVVPDWTPLHSGTRIGGGTLRPLPAW